MTDQTLERGQTFFVVKGMTFMQTDQIVEVIEVEVGGIIHPGSFTSKSLGLCRVGENAFKLRSVAYEKALAAQGHRVVLATDTRRKHLDQWGALVQELSHEMPDGWDRDNFNAAEFECKHDSRKYKKPMFRDLEHYGGGAGRMDRHFIERLQLSRKIAGIPYNINSGWRCIFWNKIVGGSPDSSHRKGLAADIAATTSQQRYTIVGALIQAGFKRIGIREDFIHVDVDPTKEQGIIWLY